MFNGVMSVMTANEIRLISIDYGSAGAEMKCWRGRVAHLAGEKSGAIIGSLKARASKAQTQMAARGSPRLALAAMAVAGVGFTISASRLSCQLVLRICSHISCCL
jgi:hypothetical protein